MLAFKGDTCSGDYGTVAELFLALAIWRVGVGFQVVQTIPRAGGSTHVWTPTRRTRATRSLQTQNIPYSLEQEASICAVYMLAFSVLVNLREGLFRRCTLG